MKGAQEHLLRDVLGLTTVADDARREVVHAAAKLDVELLEGVRVAAAQTVGRSIVDARGPVGTGHAVPLRAGGEGTVTV